MAASTIQPSTASGPLAMSMASRSSPSTVPERSVTASVACDAPRSAASTTRADGLRAKRDGGRPPVERASPTGETRPSAMSESTRVAMVERASPVTVASSARVRGRPSRSSWNSSLAPEVPSADPRLMSTIRIVKHTVFVDS